MQSVSRPRRSEPPDLAHVRIAHELKAALLEVAADNRRTIRAEAELAFEEHVARHHANGATVPTAPRT